MDGLLIGAALAVVGLAVLGSWHLHVRREKRERAWEEAQELIRRLDASFPAHENSSHSTKVVRRPGKPETLYRWDEASRDYVPADSEALSSGSEE